MIPNRTLIAAAVFSLALLGCRREGHLVVDDTGEGGSSTTTSGGMGGMPNGGAGGTGAGSTSRGGSTGTVMGMGGTLVIEGTILTPDVIIEGQLRIEGDTIVCVAEGTKCLDDKPDSVVYETGGVIVPGMIDTHNHILFDIFNEDDWVPTLPQTCADQGDCNASPYCTNARCACVDNVCRYRDHTHWPDEDEYGYMLDYKQCLEDASQGKPPWCPPSLDGDGKVRCEMNKWGELKGLIAGTTSIVGLPGTSAGCFGSLSRSIDSPQNDLVGDFIQTSALFPPSSSSANGVCQNFLDGDTDAYLIHVGEGTNQDSLDEFTDLFNATTNAGCLYAPQTAITHGTAFGPPEFAQMAAAGMKLIWSPASNLALYGTTTDIPAALAAGVTIALGPDWSMGGSQNLLDELRAANAVDDARFGNIIDSKLLLEMVTVNAAAVVGRADQLGRIAPGYKADIFVVDGRPNPYDAPLEATPTEVQMVMVGGVVLYGDLAVQPIAPIDPGCDEINVCGWDKFLCVAEADPTNKLDQNFSSIESALNGALQLLDQIPELPEATCGGCPSDESCYARTVVQTAAVSNCGGSCPPQQDCYRTAMSGNNQYNCLTVNTCYPTKVKALAPVAPLVRCP